jgi:hypothetical protein
MIKSPGSSYILKTCSDSWFLFHLDKVENFIIALIRIMEVKMVTIYCLMFSKCYSLSVDVSLKLFNTGRQAGLHNFFCSLHRSTTHEPVLIRTPRILPQASEFN